MKDNRYRVRLGLFLAHSVMDARRNESRLETGQPHITTRALSLILILCDDQHLIPWSTLPFTSSIVSSHHTASSSLNFTSSHLVLK